LKFFKNFLKISISLHIAQQISWPFKNKSKSALMFLSGTKHTLIICHIGDRVMGVYHIRQISTKKF